MLAFYVAMQVFDIIVCEVGLSSFIQTRSILSLKAQLAKSVQHGAR
jgi:hypothetical protein